jgi:hypothetical protein
MLDAAQRRIAAIQRQQLESPATAPVPVSGRAGGHFAPVAGQSPPIHSAAATATPPARPVAATGAGKAPDLTVSSSSKNAAPKAQPSGTAAPKLQRSSPTGPKDEEKKPESNAPAAPRPAETPVIRPEAGSAHEDRSPLGISDLRLCRKVSGFGSFESLDATSLKAGQHVLVYCELAGLRYEAADKGFVSRVSSHIEIRPAGGGPAQWDHDLGAAEDVCRRRRRDYYVNYRVELPKSLVPGSYRLRLIQNDLVAHHSTSAEIPLSITR